MVLPFCLMREQSSLKFQRLWVYLVALWGFDLLYLSTQSKDENLMCFAKKPTLVKD